MIGTPQMIKLLNKDVIEGIIRTSGPISRPGIAKQSNLSLVTVNKIVDNLLQEEKIKTVENEQSTPGRKAQYYVINENFNYYIGIYYERNCFQGAIANAVGDLVYEEKFPIGPDHSALAVESVLDAAIDKLKNYFEGQTVDAIGIGVPGVVQDGVVSNIPNIPEWEGVDLEKRLRDKFHIDIFLENDVNLVTMGMYYRDYTEQTDNMVYLYLDKGVGSGIIMNGNLLKGSTNFAGEIGCLSYIFADHEGEDPDSAFDYKNRLQVQVEKCLEKLESFPEKCEEWLNAKKILCDITATAILGVVCVLNPEFLVLNCKALQEEDIYEIRNLVAKRIGSENIPVIDQITDLQTLGVQGAVNICIKECNSIYTLEKRQV